MKALRITQLDLRQIGPFGDLTLHFPEKPSGMEDKAEIHILTGENGTGKTTVLEMLAGVFNHGASNFQERLRSNSQDGSISVDFNKGGKIVYSYQNQQPNVTANNEYIEKGYKEVYSMYPNPNRRFDIACFAYSGFRKMKAESIQLMANIDRHPFMYALDFNNSVDYQLIQQWLSNNLSEEAIREKNREHERVLGIRKKIQLLQDSISNIIDKKITFDIDMNKPIIQIIACIDDEKLNFNQLPDGLKSIIAWIADLLMRMDRVQWVDDTPVFERNFILLLDEIEVHMHPAWQRKILPAVQQLFPNAQIFISTHSPFVVGSVDGAWIHKLEKPNGDSKLAPGYPKRSEDARSYRYWLEEVFGIDSEYGVGAEKELKHFYELRSALLKGANGTTQDDLITTARSLAGQSKELQNIMEFELRQLNRTLQTTLSL